MQQLALLEYLIEGIMGKEKWSRLCADETLLIRTGYQIATERKIRPIDVIQALQIMAGTWTKDQEPENREGVPQTVTEILKYSLMPSVWRRKLSTIAHYNAERSTLTYEAIMAEYERIGIEVIKEVCAPKRRGRKSDLDCKKEVLVCKT